MHTDREEPAPMSKNELIERQEELFRQRADLEGKIDSVNAEIEDINNELFPVMR